MKRWIAWILLTVILTGAAAFGEEAAPGGSYTLAGLDETQYRSWGSNAFFANMEELTGIHFDTRQYTTAAEWTAAKQAMTAGGDLPDVLFKAQLTSWECMELLDRGVLVDLAPYLETCCPHLWSLLQANEGYLDAITLPDGRIAALPYINETPAQNIMWINQSFLKKAGKSMPTTAEELTEVLRAFRDHDVNGNGNPNDETPFGFLGPYDLKYLAHAFGMICNEYNVYEDGTGTVRYMPLDERFPEFIRWLRQLYQEGLLDQDGFSQTDSMRTVSSASDPVEYGILMAPMITTLLPSEWLGEYVCMPALTCDGEAVYRDFGGGLQRGTFAVTTACRDVPEILGWVDRLYTEEGAILATVGRKNKDYIVDGDGTWRLTESASSDSYHSVSATISSAAAFPGYSADAFQARYNDAGLARMMGMLKEFSSACKRAYPYVNLTRAESERVNELQMTLGMLVDMHIARWVLGEEEPTDERFEAFAAELKEAGLDEFLSIWQKKLDERGGN